MTAKKAHPRDVTQRKKRNRDNRTEEKTNKQTNEKKRKTKTKNNSCKTKKIVGVLHRGNPPRKEICHLVKKLTKISITI